MLAECYRAELMKRRINMAIDDVTRDKITRVSKWLCGDHKIGLLLYGTVGSGKTTMANAVCELIGIIHDSALQDERRGVRRISANTLVELKIAEDKDKPGGHFDTFESYKRADMLFIDDIGTESASIKSWGNEFTPVIDLMLYRYERQLFTLLTSNLDDRGIEGFYGPRVADRFNEMFDKLSYTNRSYRK